MRPDWSRKPFWFHSKEAKLLYTWIIATRKHLADSVLEKMSPDGQLSARYMVYDTVYDMPILSLYRYVIYHWKVHSMLGSLCQSDYQCVMIKVMGKSIKICILYKVCLIYDMQKQQIPWFHWFIINFNEIILINLLCRLQGPFNKLQ